MYDLFQRIVPQEYFYEIEYIKKGLRLFFEQEDTKRVFKKQIEDMAFKHAVWIWEHYVQRQYAEIAVWGAGSHTQQLLSRLQEKKLRLPCVIFDRVAKDLVLYGTPVKIPRLQDKASFDCIVLSSLVYRSAMREDAYEIFGRDIPCFDLYEGYLDTQNINNDYCGVKT
jgi:hypothetical protein